MRNSKLIALLSAGALVLTSFSGLAVSGNSALAASTPRQRFSDAMFQSVVTHTGATYATNHNKNTSVGANRFADKVSEDNAATIKDNYTGFVNKTYDAKALEEVNDAYGGNGYADVAWKANPALTLAQLVSTGQYYNYKEDRTGAIVNDSVYAIWQKGYVGDNALNAWLYDGFADEIAPTVAGGAEYIQLQTVDAADKTPARDTEFAALSKDKDLAPSVLRPVQEGVLFDTTYWNTHGVALYGLADGNKKDAITLALDAQRGHYTKWNGYIYVGDNGNDDDGEYIAVEIAYPKAIVGDTGVLYGGEPNEYDIAEVIKKDLPHDQWVWVIADDSTDSFEFSDGTKSMTVVSGTKAKVRAKATATKGATCNLKLYNTRVDDDECYVWQKELGIATPNFYENIYLRADVDVNGNGVDYANSTYTTANKKAEIRATATMLVNEGLTDIPQGDIHWTWTPATAADEKLITDKKVTKLESGIGNNILTIEAADMDEVTTITFIARAYSDNNDNQQFAGGAQGVFDNNGNTGERMYGSRTITVVFDKDFVPTITTDALPVGTGFTVEDGYYVVTSDTEVEFAKYVGTATSYTVPAQVTFGNFTYNVTSVGKKAFASKTQLKEVTVPESVTVLGNGAFKNCKKLTSVTFLGNITNTPKNVFLKAGAKNGKKLKVSVGAGTSEETIKGLKKSNKNAKIK